jgi:hypothetical protein
MLRSRMTMNCATQQTASSQALREPGRIPARSGAASVLAVEVTAFFYQPKIPRCRLRSRP